MRGAAVSVDMTWACRQCGRTDHEAPEGACRTCGHPAVVPAGEADDGADTVLVRISDRLFHPGRQESGLLAANGLVSVPYRLVVLFSALLLVAFGVSLLP
jgi:hypothetical protein